MKFVYIKMELSEVEETIIPAIRTPIIIDSFDQLFEAKGVTELPLQTAMAALKIQHKLRSDLMERVREAALAELGARLMHELYRMNVPIENEPDMILNNCTPLCSNSSPHPPRRRINRDPPPSALGTRRRDPLRPCTAPRTRSSRSAWHAGMRLGGRACPRAVSTRERGTSIYRKGTRVSRRKQ
ncbi:hypothetical protein BC938DRAFT_483215 [Jimgerdemannia flammicorona]|uniref:Uncharacterized protein n=1 Tax=Jimgerdemannia flammicorona TaxID=994334 RepID=A0A433QCD2_9FUNG|nr:hypothetical protein BC938DRAFT_483215 [Jimgerdemannia flammicorona]